MKTAIYIEDGVTQVVITPETEFENDVIKTLSNTNIKAEIFYGQFYNCKGGWIRQTAYQHQGIYEDKRDCSIIIKTSKDTLPS